MRSVGGGAARPAARRRVAWVLVVTVGILAADPRPAEAGAGEWAKWAVEKVERSLKWLWSKVPQILKEDDPAIAAAMKIEGRQEITKLAADGEKLLDLERMMTTRYEEGLHAFKEGMDMAQRHETALENTLKDVERLTSDAQQETEKAAADSGRWDGLMQTLEAEQAAMRDLVTRAYAEPVPPACPFLQEEIRKSRKRLEDAYYVDYLKGSERAMIHAAMAHTNFGEAMAVWGEMILSSIGLVSNIVTTITGIGEFLGFLKGSVLLLKGFLSSGLKALTWAGSKLAGFLSKAWRVVTGKEAISNLLRATGEQLARLFDACLHKIQTILARVTQTLSNAWGHLKAGEFRKAWDDLATLKDDVSEAQGLQAAGEQAVAQAESAAATARQEAQGIVQRWNEASADKLDYLNNLHTAEETIRKAKAEAEKTNRTIAAYALETVKVVDDLTLQARGMSVHFMHGYRFRQEAQEAEIKYQEAEWLMKRAKAKIYRELETLSALLKKKCTNSAS